MALLAQCIPGAVCELPRTLPWYFSAVIAALWLAAVAGAAVLAWRRLRLRAERREQERRRQRHRERRWGDPGTDLEPR